MKFRKLAFRKEKGFPLFICFIGIDGSGKTTLALNLLKSLKENGVKAKYVHALIRPLVLRPLMALGRAAFARGKSKDKNYVEFRDAKRKGLKKHSYILKPYYWLLLIDYYPQVFFRIIVPFLFGKIVICDRYLFDTILNLGINMAYDVENNNKLIKTAFRYFPKPCETIMVDVPIETAFKRKDDIPDRNYLADRRSLYVGLASGFDIRVVDGSKKISELDQEILDIVLGKNSETPKGSN